MTATISLDTIAVVGLGSIRVMALFLAAPFFSQAAVPRRLLVGLAVMVVLLSWPAMQGSAPEPTLVSTALAALREAAIGASIGMAAAIVFAGIGLMGEFASVQGGLGAAAVIDPGNGTNSMVLNSLVQAIAILVFLAVDGHLVLLRALGSSFAQLPVGGDPVSGVVWAELASLGSIVFAVGLRIAAPFTAVLLLSNVAAGILGRVIPQLNLMSVQLPAQIGLTLMLLYLGAAPLSEAFGALFGVEFPRALSPLVGTE